MERNDNIEIFTQEQMNKEEKEKNKIYILILSVLVVSIISLILLSFFSVVSAKKCVTGAKSFGSEYVVFEKEIMQKANLDIISSSSLSEKMFLDRCLRENYLAKNADVILGATVNYLSVLLLVSFYLIVFKKNRRIISLGKAIIISVIIVFVSLFGQVVGVVGLIASPIVVYTSVKKILGTDIFGAIIFVTIVGLLNWVVLNLIVKMFS